MTGTLNQLKYYFGFCFNLYTLINYNINQTINLLDAQINKGRYKRIYQIQIVTRI